MAKLEDRRDRPRWPPRRAAPRRHRGQRLRCDVHRAPGVRARTSCGSRSCCCRRQRLRLSRCILRSASRSGGREVHIAAHERGSGLEAERRRGAGGGWHPCCCDCSASTSTRGQERGCGTRETSSPNAQPRPNALAIPRREAPSRCSRHARPATHPARLSKHTRTTPVEQCTSRLPTPIVEVGRGAKTNGANSAAPPQAE